MVSVDSDQVKGATDKLPPEQKKQADGFVDGATNVATGVAGTVGGAVKGILDTAGNTVGLPIIFSDTVFLEAYFVNIRTWNT